MKRLTFAEFYDVVEITSNSFYGWRRRLDAEREQGDATASAMNAKFLPLHLIAIISSQIELPRGTVMRD